MADAAKSSGGSGIGSTLLLGGIGLTAIAIGISAIANVSRGNPPLANIFGPASAHAGFQGLASPTGSVKRHPPNTAPPVARSCVVNGVRGKCW